MKIATLILGIIFLSLADFLYIRRRHVLLKKKICLYGLIPRGWKQILCFLLIPLSLSVLTWMYICFYKLPILFTLKRICVIAVLWPIAISDFQEYRIPNKLVLYGFLLRLPLLLAELVLHAQAVWPTAFNELIAIVGSVIVCIVCMLLAHGSLGMGDLKLLMFMAAFLGVSGITYSMFISIFFSAIFAIGLLLFKKKSRKDVIPFAPFILVGTFVCFILTGV